MSERVRIFLDDAVKAAMGSDGDDTVYRLRSSALLALKRLPPAEDPLAAAAMDLARAVVAREEQDPLRGHDGPHTQAWWTKTGKCRAEFTAALAAFRAADKGQEGEDPVKVLCDAIAWVESQPTLLTRCDHGSALTDCGGERLEPPCGCRASGGEA